MASLAAARASYARAAMRWAEEAGMAAPRVEAAFAAVPRERYLTPPPWRVFGPGGLMDEETSDPAKLYDDVLVVLDRKRGINNGQPSLHAAWIAGVEPQPGETVVQIGIGTGYYTAILAELVGEGGRVEAFEIEPRLAAIARENLAALPQVGVNAESAIGRPLPAADVVYVAAGAAAPDVAWLDALRPGGRLVCPWQPMSGEGHTLRLTRRTGGFAARLHAPVSFVACVGAGLAEAKPALRVPSRHLGETRSAWLTRDRAPDDSATAVYRHLWFSAEPV